MYTSYSVFAMASLFFVSDNIMADVATKHQTTVVFLSTIVTNTKRLTELTKILTDLM